MAVKISFTAAVIITGMLICGTINTVDMKMQFSTSSTGDDPDMGMHPFQKPWFAVWGMFLSMSCGLLVHFGIQFFCPPMVTKDNVRPPMSVFGTIWRCSVPALGDLASSALSSIGLLYVDASTYQMLRGASILSTAALSVLVLKRELSRDQCIALFIVTLSICAIAWAGVTGESGKTQQSRGDNNAFIGVALILLGQLFVACQFVWEERVMKVAKVPPMLLLGIEGVFGSIFTYLCIFPVLRALPGDDAFGSFEDFNDSITMLNNSYRLRLLFAIYLGSIVMFNVSSVFCTSVLSGVHRSLVTSGLRTMSIWFVDLALFYCFTSGAYGEQWLGLASWVQLFGFGACLYGSLLYSGFVDLPKLARESTLPIDAEYSTLAGQ